jgi:hypothetical protein
LETFLHQYELSLGIFARDGLDPRALALRIR